MEEIGKDPDKVFVRNMAVDMERDSRGEPP
jgi:hypothetical protein